MAPAPRAELRGRLCLGSIKHARVASQHPRGQEHSLTTRTHASTVRSRKRLALGAYVYSAPCPTIPADVLKGSASRKATTVHTTRQKYSTRPKEHDAPVHRASWLSATLSQSARGCPNLPLADGPPVVSEPAKSPAAHHTQVIIMLPFLRQGAARLDARYGASLAAETKSYPSPAR